MQVAGTYLTAQPATWGEGDWNAAPAIRGDGVFNQLDIVASQQAGAYLTGSYYPQRDGEGNVGRTAGLAALAAGGAAGDSQVSLIYDAASGSLSVDAPAGVEFTSISIDSAAGIFTGSTAQGLSGSFDNDAHNNIFKATFGSSFGSLSFGNVSQSGLSEAFVRSDLTVIGSLAGGGALGDVDLVYVPVPEPSNVILLVCGLIGLYGSIHRKTGTVDE